jgi:hypothetical protein
VIGGQNKNDFKMSLWESHLKVWKVTERKKSMRIASYKRITRRRWYASIQIRQNLSQGYVHSPHNYLSKSWMPQIIPLAIQWLKIWHLLTKENILPPTHYVASK